MKEILHRLQPIQVYIVLFLSSCYFLVQIFIANKSHSITLLVHAYHMLCNIIALSGCIITIKVKLSENENIPTYLSGNWLVNAIGAIVQHKIHEWDKFMSLIWLHDALDAHSELSSQIDGISEDWEKPNATRRQNILTD